MNPTKITKIFAVFVWSILFITPSFAAKQEYNYPYQSPLQSTLTAGFIFAQPGFLRLNYEGEIEILANRNEIPTFEGRGMFNYRLYAQEKNTNAYSEEKNRDTSSQGRTINTNKRETAAPMILIFGGLGASYSDGKQQYLAKLYHDKGFHVVTLPGTVVWDFAIQASRSGVPGISERDALDYVQVLNKVLADIHDYLASNPMYKSFSGKLGMMGLSMSGLTLAYLSKLEIEGKGIPVEKYLLVNSPVDVLEGMQAIETMLKRSDALWSKEEQIQILDEFFDRAFYVVEQHGHDPDFFERFAEYIPLTESRLELIASSAFRSSIGEVIYASQQIEDRGVLLETGSNARREEAESFYIIGDENNRGFLNNLVLPIVREEMGENYTIGELNDLVSMERIAPFLRMNPKVGMIHNENDFLLTPRTTEFLKEVFADRLKLYPLGGHVGNLWFPDNREYMANYFNELLE